MLGSTFAHYRITSKLGEGGMGEVYRATDGRLNREVAVKILPESWSSDADRLARFAREAQLLASLNHPNIGQIYGLEHQDGRSAIILELVDGETLAERIARGPLPWNEARRIAFQIADALAAAHQRGIVHRDLKPANVKLTAAGTAKVLDFGLAKSLEDSPLGDPQHSPTLTGRATLAGVLLGTAAYMSPEQAKGEPVDERTDIWSFAVVLFEMLTGRELFAAPSVTETLARVLTRELDFAELPGDTPASMQRVLRLSLVRDPRMRLHAAADSRILLEDVAGDAGSRSEPPSSGIRTRSWAIWLPIVVLAGAGLGFLGYRAGTLLERGSSPNRLAIHLEPGQELVVGVNATIEYSPDGSSLAFCGRENGRRSLYRRELGRRECTPIPGTENGEAPFFSPDGRWLGFVSGGRLMKVPAEGGRPFALGEARGVGGATWLRNDTVVFSPIYSEGLFRVQADGGQPERLTRPERAEGVLGHWWPAPLPDHERILFTAFRTPVDTSRIGVLELASGRIHWVVEGGFFGRYVPPGYLVYANGQRLYALPFDAAKATATGSAVPVLDDLWVSQTAGFAAFSVSGRGSIAFVSATLGSAPRNLVWLDRSGRAVPAAVDPRRYMSVSLSPDDREAAVSIQAESRDLWTYSLERGILSRLTTGAITEYDPRWSRDGRELYYVVDRPPFQLFRIAVGVPDSGRPIWNETPELDSSNLAVAPDGRQVVYTLTEQDTGQNLYVRSIDGREPPRPIRATRSEERHGSFSPDGRWIAYQSDETGRPEVYVEPFPGPGERVQITADGGISPTWARNGEIFYRHDDEFRTVATRPGGRFQFDAPRTLFTYPIVSAASEDSRTFDVTRDGSRILAVMVPEENVPRQIEVVTDWTSQLASLTRSGNAR